MKVHHLHRGTITEAPACRPRPRIPVAEFTLVQDCLSDRMIGGATVSRRPVETSKEEADRPAAYSFSPYFK